MTIVGPPDDAAKALGKKTHWRVYKKPPTLADLTVEPIGALWTALSSSTTRMLIVKVGDHRYLAVTGPEYETCVAHWRAAASSKSAAFVDDPAVAALLPTAIYAWCINRMYTAAGTVPPKPKHAKSKPALANPKAHAKRRSLRG